MSDTDDVFLLSVAERDGQPVLIMAGELDVAGKEAALARLREVQANGSGQVTLDMRRLDFMDVSGVHVLLEANARAQTQGHELALMPSPPVRRLLEMLGLEEHFRFEDGTPPA